MKKPSQGNLPTFLLFLCVLALAIGSLAFWKLIHPEIPQAAVFVGHRGPAQAGPTKISAGTDSALAAMDEEITSLVDRAIPSVVSIITTAAPDREALLRQFFGIGRGKSAQVRNMGSGMIVSPEGYVVTNWHVVNGATQVTVQLSDGRTLEAKLAGADQRSDIAILKIEADGLTPIELGDSEQVKVGQTVFAVGNPFGLQETVTQGIISAKGRRTLSEAENEFFQTSTTINPGNSGGPLIDIHGQVIGVNNFILSHSGGSEGIGFSIPSNVARRVFEDIVHHGRVIHPWFGVVMRPLTSTLAQQLGLSDTHGALVAATLANSPAERSGLHVGDVIVSFDGKPIRDGKDLRNRIAEAGVGVPATFVVLREGKELELKVVMEEEPSS